MTEYLAIQHASLVVSDLDAALRFYTGVLGLEIEPGRPELGFAGAWLKVGAQQIHLLVVPNPDPVEGRPPHAGRDRHTALTLRGLEAVAARLERHGVAFTRSRSGRAALFCRDPDGNAIELIEAAG